MTAVINGHSLMSSFSRFERTASVNSSLNVIIKTANEMVVIQNAYMRVPRSIVIMCILASIVISSISIFARCGFFSLRTRKVMQTLTVFIYYANII